MKSAIYCRVSTEGQELEGSSLQTQLEACLKYCELKGYEATTQFSEVWSGLSLDRPEIERLREAVRSEQLDVVVVYSLDRLTRDPVHGVILMQEFEKHGVSLEAVSETVDNSEIGKLVFYIKGYAAKLDAERRRDATGRGKQAVLRSGRLPQGTGIGIYGYQWIPEYKKRTPIEREAKVVQRMFDMVVGGISCFKIARTLNEEIIPTKSGKKWEARTVSRIVRNPAYMGMTYFGMTSGRERKSTPEDSWHVLPDVTPAIVSRETFESAQAALERSRALHPGRTLHEYPLTGSAVCGHCGSPLIGSCLRGKYRYYKCRGTYSTSSRNRICNARYVKADWLEEVVWDKVKSVLASPELLLSEVRKQSEEEEARLTEDNIDREMRLLKRQLKSYKAQERRLAGAFKLGFSSDIILDEMNQTRREQESDEKRLASLVQTRENAARMVDVETDLRELCARVVLDLDNCTNTDKKDAFRYLDLKVTATPEGADIKGYLDGSVLTTGQTSALRRGYSCLRRRDG